jgi:hypothetical protein
MVGLLALPSAALAAIKPESKKRIFYAKVTFTIYNPVIAWLKEHKEYLNTYGVRGFAMHYVTAKDCDLVCTVYTNLLLNHQGDMGYRTENFQLKDFQHSGTEEILRYLKREHGFGYDRL